MKNKVSKFVVILLALGVIGSFCGCSNDKETNSAQPKSVNESDGLEENNQTETTGENLINNADLSGSVIEVLGNGCMLSQTMLEGDELAYESAEGNDSENQVKVIYEDGIVFQSATIETTSGRILELTDINKDDIKKQTRLLLYGDFQNTYTFKATKIVSYYFQ